MASFIFKKSYVVIAVLVVFLTFYIFNLKSKIASQNSEILTLNNEILTLTLSVEKQNRWIKELEIKSKKPSNLTKEETRIRKIYLKDTSCENELIAYKALFEGKK